MGFDWVPLKNYKRHYICLTCQKGFKRSSKEDMKHTESSDLSNLMSDYYASAPKKDIVKYINEAHQKLNVICPNCRNLMLQVHYNFEVPPQRDTKSWKRLQVEMSPEVAINYKKYIPWHLLELQKTTADSDKFGILKANLTKLERA